MKVFLYPIDRRLIYAFQAWLLKVENCQTASQDCSLLPQLGVVPEARCGGDVVDVQL